VRQDSWCEIRTLDNLGQNWVPNSFPNTVIPSEVEGCITNNRFQPRRRQRTSAKQTEKPGWLTRLFFMKLVVGPVGSANQNVLSSPRLTAHLLSLLAHQFRIELQSPVFKP
jgi:hypothetical protein